MAPPAHSNMSPPSSPSRQEDFSSGDFLEKIDAILGEDESTSFLYNLSRCDDDEDEEEEDAEDDADKVEVGDTVEEVDVPEEEISKESKKERQVRVKFSGMDGPSPPPGLNLEEASRSELIQRLGALQERLVQAQVDLSGEKKNRRRKEKNMFKLAKELNKQHKEGAQREEDIARLNSLLEKLGIKLQMANEIEENLRETIDQYDKKLAKISVIEQNPENQREKVVVGGDGDKTAKSLPVHPPVPFKEKVGSASSSTRATNLSGFSDPLPATRSAAGRGQTSSSSGPSHGGFSGIVLGIAFCLAAAVLNILHPDALTPDGICAPVMPGTGILTLSGKEFSASAPWWAPDRMKVSSFRFLCGDRPRVYLDMAPGKLHFFEENGENTKTLYRTNAEAVDIKAATLTLTSKKGATSEIKAPWTR